MARPRQPPPASMRPRVFPAEDEDSMKTKKELQEASMRPRVFPAEDTGKVGIVIEDGQVLQ